LPRTDDLPREIYVTDAKDEDFSDAQTKNCRQRQNGAKGFRRCRKDFPHFFVSEIRCSFLTPSRGMVMPASGKLPRAYSQAFAMRRMEDSVIKTFSTVFFDRPTGCQIRHETLNGLRVYFCQRLTTQLRNNVRPQV
jgi:hypothetical protein